MYKFQGFRYFTIASTLRSILRTAGLCSLNLNYSAIKYKNDDQKYILKIVNDHPSNELKRFALSQSRIQKLDSWKKKRGNFDSIAQVLDVEGFGVKVLEKFCDSILELKESSIKDCEVQIQVAKKTSTKKTWNFVTPVLSESKRDSISTSVSVNIGVNCVSWGAFEIDCEGLKLTDWGLHDFTDESKKLHIFNILQLVFNIAKRIPKADVYVLESPPTNVPNQSQGSKTVIASSQKTQLISMLSAILAIKNPFENKIVSGDKNVSTDTGKENIKDYKNTEKISYENFDDQLHSKSDLYYLRPLLAARLHQTLIGNERVSTESVITDLLSKQHFSNMLIPLNDSSDKSASKTQQPAIYIPDSLKTLYMSAVSVHKEQLGQALLLGMTFMQICVQQDEKSLRKVINRNS